MKSVVITVGDRFQSKVTEAKENRQVVNREAAQNYINTGWRGSKLMRKRRRTNNTKFFVVGKKNTRLALPRTTPPKKKQQPKNKNKKQQNKTNVDESEQACFNLLCFIFVCSFEIYIWWVCWLSRLITSSQRIIDGISVRFVWVVRCVSWMIWWAL